MRETFREHPDFYIERIKTSWGYDSRRNRIITGCTEAEPIKSVVHEITHWAILAFLDHQEILENFEIYEKLAEGVDCLTFSKLSIEERIATYNEELVNE